MTDLELLREAWEALGRTVLRDGCPMCNGRGYTHNARRCAGIEIRRRLGLPIHPFEDTP
jgi:hypothetical protein